MILSVVLGWVSGSAPSGGTGHGREPWKAACSLGSSSLPLPARLLPRYPLTNLLSRIHWSWFSAVSNAQKERRLIEPSFSFFVVRPLAVYRELDAVDSFTTSDSRQA